MYFFVVASWEAKFDILSIFRKDNLRLNSILISSLNEKNICAILWNKILFTKLWKKILKSISKSASNAVLQKSIKKPSSLKLIFFKKPTQKSLRIKKMNKNWILNENNKHLTIVMFCLKNNCFRSQRPLLSVLNLKQASEIWELIWAIILG